METSLETSQLFGGSGNRIARLCRGDWGGPQEKTPCVWTTLHYWVVFVFTPPDTTRFTTAWRRKRKACGQPTGLSSFTLFIRASKGALLPVSSPKGNLRKHLRLRFYPMMPCAMQRQLVMFRGAPGPTTLSGLMRWRPFTICLVKSIFGDDIYRWHFLRKRPHPWSGKFPRGTSEATYFTQKRTNPAALSSLAKSVGGM